MANPKSVSKFGWDVIHVAAETGNKSLVKMLLDRDVDVDTLTQTGETPLHIALNRGNVSIAELLFESGADPTIQNCKGMSALHLLSGYRTNQHIIRRDFFFCWITLPVDLKKMGFQEKKRKRILPDIITKLFVLVWSEISENYYFEILLSFIKLHKMTINRVNVIFFFFFLR